MAYIIELLDTADKKRDALRSYSNWRWVMRSNSLRGDEYSELQKKLSDDNIFYLIMNDNDDLEITSDKPVNITEPKPPKRCYEDNFNIQIFNLE